MFRKQNVSKKVKIQQQRIRKNLADEEDQCGNKIVIDQVEKKKSIIIKKDLFFLVVTD